jgi:TetR/AcrR family transcriptional repressor of lmrAB and yxaGH operons
VRCHCAVGTRGDVPAAIGPRTESEELRTAAGRVFDTWAADLTDDLVSAGVDQAAAASFAWMPIATTEGAVALARAQRSMEPLDIVEGHLLSLAARLR